MEMSQEEFKNAIDQRRLREVEVFDEQTRYGHTNHCIFIAISKQGVHINAEGSNWFEVWKKLPEWLRIES